MEKDTLFQSEFFKPGEFEFSKPVVTVFDDMISRSVPFYTQLIQAIGLTSLHFSKNKSKFKLYDLGCSTGALLQVLMSLTQPNQFFEYIGVDLSVDMLAQLIEKSSKFNQCKITTIEHNLNFPIHIKNADSVVLNLVLQFLNQHVSL